MPIRHLRGCNMKGKCDRARVGFNKIFEKLNRLQVERIHAANPQKPLHVLLGFFSHCFFSFLTHPCNPSSPKFLHLAASAIFAEWQKDETSIARASRGRIKPRERESKSKSQITLSCLCRVDTAVLVGAPLQEEILSFSVHILQASNKFALPDGHLTKTDKRDTPTVSRIALNARRFCSQQFLHRSRE